MKTLLLDCFDAVLEEREHAEVAVSKALYGMLMEIVGLGLRKETADGEADTDFLRRVDDYIDERIRGHVTLEELAGSVNLSKYHFCRTFKERTGVSPMQYVVRKKIDASKYFLQYTAEPVQSIASRFGFTDQSHYARQFRRITGLSPRAYRKKGQSADPPEEEAPCQPETAVLQ